MESKNQAKERIHSLFQLPENRENLDLLSKFLSQPSKGLCLCKVMPEERVKILSFFDDDPWNGRIHIIDMVNPPLGPMDLQQVIIDINNRSNTKKDIFFIYNIEGCIRLIQTTADEYFQRLNLIRDFFMQFEVEFVFFVTEPLVNTMIQNAFDFYDWMKITFTFTPELKQDSLRQPIKPDEKETIDYLNPLDKIEYLEKSIERVKNENARAIQQLELGELYLQVGDYENALKIFNKAMKVFKKTKDRGNIERVRANMDQVNRLKKSNKSVADTITRTGTGIAGGHDFNWDELLFRIQHRNVIPVIGPGLYRVEVESKGISGVLLYDYLAEQVSKECGYTLIPGESHRFAKACLAFLKKTNNDYIKLSHFLQKTLNGVRLVPAGSLWKLARIKSFNIFITTAYDDFLVNTIKTVRDIPVKEHYYSISEKNLDQLNEGLFNCIRESKCTLVYHLFGNIKKNVTPAYTEKNILETLLEIQEDKVRFPENNLFRGLIAKGLLFMGCDFDDWLYRLFIRIISNTPYGRAGQNTYVADDFSNYKKDPFQELPRFLRDYNTGVYYTGSDSDFVDILFEKLNEKYPEDIIQPSNYPATVFISFKGSDRAEARRLASQLRKDGINVWLDEWELKLGDDVGQTIAKAIEKCPVFIPLISENSRGIMTDGAAVKYHIKEWEWAYSRQLNNSNKIILPVKVDNTKWIYGSFRDFVFLNIPGGRREGDYEKLKERLLEIQRRFSE
jgi:tetratricopeptide (TPR) repeat protein